MKRTSPPSLALAVLVARASTSTPLVAASTDTSFNCYDVDGGFPKDDWAHCQPITPGLFLYYTPADESGNVMLGLRAPGHTNGWSALALAGNGGMKGASQIVVRMDEENEGEWVAEDRYSEDYITPKIDESQNVKLLFAHQDEEKGTSWGVKVQANSCDVEDYPIEDRSAWMHWALGTGHTFSFHGDKRGQFHANLMRAPPVSSIMAEPRSAFGEEEIESLDVLMPDVPVVLGEGGEDPTNPYVCSFFDLEELKKEHDIEAGHRDETSDGQIHVTRFSPVIDPDSSKYVHHMILFECMEGYAEEEGYEHRKVLPECESMPNGCWEMKWPWAVGSQDIVFPDNVGMPMGGKAGSKWVLLQMHYYNPSLDSGIKDSSGVQVQFTTKLRELDAGAMQLNGGTSPMQRPPLPAGQPSITIPTFVVPSECTEPWEDTINILGVVHHEHLVGKQMSIEVQRDGTNLGPMRLERRFDFNHQSLEESSISQLLPGDEMVVTCKYDTSTRTEDVEFGDQSQNEMCYAVVLYYPRKKGRDSFFYLPADESQLQMAEMACSSPGVDEFADVSMCAQSYVEDTPTFFNLELEFSFGALELCNSDMFESMFKPYYPNACPPCYVDNNCSIEDVAMWGQDVLCDQKCGGFGLTVYPDTTSTATSVTHGTSCAWTKPPVYFEHTPPAPATCEVQGDLSDPPSSGTNNEQETAAATDSAGNWFVKGAGAWGAMAVVGFAVIW